jgi:hypothetical protein
MATANGTSKNRRGALVERRPSRWARLHLPAIGHGARIAAASGLLAAAVAGCTPKPLPVDFSGAPRQYRSGDYRDVYDRWTRHETVVHQLELVLEVWSTYKSWDFREAYMAHYAELYGMEDEARERVRQVNKDAAASAYEFVVTAQTNNYKWNDLEKKSSPWRLSLVDGLGRELYPEPIKVEKLPEMVEREFFPVKTPFTRMYTVRFARPAGGDGEFSGERSGTLALRVSGPFGRTDLVWTSKRQER